LRNLSNELLAEIYGQSSNDPFLMLVTLHNNETPIYLVNNVEDIVSNGKTYLSFPMKITLAPDDGESVRTVKLILDNVSRDLIYEIRSNTSPIEVTIDMILASRPDDIQVSLENLSIRNVVYNAQQISADLYMDDVLNTEMPSERYNPSDYPGIF
jgi:hypothetical protein